ncbi:MAG: calcium-binding protein, partial [Selenomonadaceae bacterium]|nr:calcium-binding protein [Selenomonadaceae bacterium]
MEEFIFDVQRFDDINNTVDGASIVGTAGNDTITNTGANVTINALTGDDLISLSADDKLVYIQYAAGDGNDTVRGGYTSADGSLNYQLQISGSAYTSAASGANVIIGVGTDSITIQDGISDAGVKGIDINGSYRDSLGNIPNSNDEVNVYGTDAADSIVNKGQDVTIHALGGNDTIHNDGASNFYIEAGTGSNEIYNDGGTTGVIIQGSDEADRIFNNNGAGSSIDGGGGDDEISTGNSNDVTISGGSGNDTIEAEGARIYINAGEGADSIINSGNNGTEIYGGAGADTVHNTGMEAYISGGDNDDVVINTIGSSNYYNHGSTLGSSARIFGEDGNDSIVNDASGVSIVGGAGNDTIINQSYLVTISTDGAIMDNYVGGSASTINGGEGNDYISNDVHQVTIEGGAGNDTIVLGDNSDSVVVQYNGDDGNDSITGFKSTDSLRIGDGTGTYSAQTISNDVVIASYGASLTLSGAASLDSLNILGTYSGDSTESSGIYNQVANTLITGTDNADSISNVGDNVTIQALGGNDT